MAVGAPSTGGILAGTVTVSGTATDVGGSGIDEVTVHLRKVKANGKLDGFLTSVQAPVVDGAWSTEIDTRAFPDGSYGITVVGQDRTGNQNPGGGTHVKPLTS
ncbi:Ig-like domain-containing protein [Oerskovia sp. M15]